MNKSQDPRVHCDRREVMLGAGAAALTTMSARASGAPLPASGPAPQDQAPWYTRIRAIGQTNFNERDPEKGNVKAWADYWASVGVEALALSVSGPVAFYPTKVPYFHVSTYLNGRDLFGECLEAAKTRGIRVFGRMSPDLQYLSPELLSTHPEWLRRTADGGLMSPAPNFAFTCQFTGHFNEQQPAVLRELNARYDLDGLFMNGWPKLQVCYCDVCRKIGDPHSDVYKAALMKDAQRLARLYRGIVHEKNPNNFYSFNILGSLEESGLDQWQLTREAEWFNSDNQARATMTTPVWQAAQQVKFARSMMGDRPVSAVTAGYTRSGPTMWRQISDISAEPICRMAQTAAAGGVVWYHQLGLTEGFSVDRRWQRHGREFFKWLAANRPHFRNVRSLANVAIVTPSRTLSRYRRDAHEDPADYFQGLYAALITSRIPFDLVHEKDLTPERLAQYHLLVLPNFALMSNAQAAALRAYADRGGSLLSTFETGVYDENGNARSDFALADIFGIARAGPPRRDTSAVRGVYKTAFGQLIRSRGDVAKGFDDTSWIAGPVWIQPIEAVPGAPTTFLDTYPIYPPEAVYPRTPPGNLPSLVLNERNGGRFAYFAGDMDATFWRLDDPDIGLQFANTLRWLLHDHRPVSVAGEGLLEAIAWQTEPGYAIHLLNYNGANAFRGHMRKGDGIGPQDVRVRLPAPNRIRKARLLWSGGTAAFRQEGRIVELTVPGVDFYEVVALEV